VKQPKTHTPSLAEQLSNTSRARVGWTFSAEARKDIDECLALNRSGKGWIACEPLARALKAKYQIAAGITTIRARLREIAGGTW